MTFTVFHKTGELRDAQGDWDCDEGYDVEIEIAEEKAHRDIAEMIYNDYIEPMAHNDANYYFDRTLDVIVGMLDDLDCWDGATELYFEALREKYSEEQDDRE